MIIRDNKIVKFGISQKKDGQMILRYGAEAINNRNRYFKSVGIDDSKVVSVLLDHGNKVKRVKLEDAEAVIAGYDSLISDSVGACLSVTVSDCLPIFFYDKNKEVIAIAHAGWRGVLLNIVGETILKFIKEFRSDVGSIEVYVGPHIKKCHFEIKDDVLKKFNDYLEFIIKREDRIFVDLSEIVKKQLADVGVLPKNIEVSDECTYCNENYFSYRRDNVENPKSQVAYICLA